MKVIEYNMLPQNAADTRTMQDFGSMLGMKPYLSKAIVELYPNLTLQKLTEQLQSVYAKDVKSLSEIDSFSFEWMIKTNQIPRIRIAEDCSETGAGGAEFAIILEKKYYNPREVFELENEQQLFVKRRPEKLAENKWRYWVQLVSPNRDRVVNTNFMRRGLYTTYVSNYHPELSERGYSKYMYNFEKHRNYISRHRVSGSFSGDFMKMQPKFFEQAGVYFKSTALEKELMDELMLSMENSMLLGHGNFDDRGNCLITEEDGRPIPIGEGIIPQLKRYCSQHRYTNLSIETLRTAINEVVARLEKKTGNKLVLMCNYQMYTQAQLVLESVLNNRILDNYLIKKNGEKLIVGAEYCGYRFGGNEITLMENQALTNRYQDKGYGLMIDTGLYEGEPNIQMITLKGMSMFKGTLKGMGGMSGGESGDVATMVHGSEISYMGYRGAKVANPYSAFILEQNVL